MCASSKTTTGRKPFFPYALPGLLYRLTRAARPVSEALADYVGLIYREGFRVDADSLLRHANLHSFLFSHLDASQLETGLMAERSRLGLAADFSAGFDAYGTETVARDKAFARIRRSSRKLVRDKGGIECALHNVYDQNMMDMLIHQKIDQYHRTQVGNPLKTAQVRQFLHELARLPGTETCSPVFSTLRCDDTIIASHFGLRCGANLHYWLPVYNPDYAHYSPGHILLWEMIRQASAAGIHSIDFGEGDTPAKRKFANREHAYFLGFYARKTPQGLTDRARMAFSWRIMQMR